MTSVIIPMPLVTAAVVPVAIVVIAVSRTVAAVVVIAVGLRCGSVVTAVVRRMVIPPITHTATGGEEHATVGTWGMTASAVPASADICAVYHWARKVVVIAMIVGIGAEYES